MSAESNEQSVPEGFAAQVMETVRARGNAYGSPAENHQTTADMYSTWLSRRLGVAIRLSAEDVCALNIIQKVSRAAFCSKDDTWLDVAGYTENIAMIRPDQRNHRAASKKLSEQGKTYNVVPVEQTAGVALVQVLPQAVPGSDTPELEIGDVVRVIGEDVEMTVAKIYDVTGKVVCQWFTETSGTSQLQSAEFALADLLFVRR